MRVTRPCESRNPTKNKAQTPKKIATATTIIMSVSVPPDQPFQLLPLFHERVWGRHTLAPYFRETDRTKRIGEAWFTCEENQTSLGGTLGELVTAHPEILGAAAEPGRHPGACPLLVKLLFTTERLSVQVHPGDEYARLHHASAGKTEAWYVLDAEPGAQVAAGFKQALTPEQLRTAALSGEIVNMLEWRDVRRGDLIFVPAGTVHAIGAGLTICEIQQNSDITYRLYDYGRPRELHLDHGAYVSQLGPYTHRQEAAIVSEGRRHLLECDYFRIEHLALSGSIDVAGGLPHYLLLVCIEGAGTIAGRPCAAGQTWMAPAHGAQFSITGVGSEWLLTYTAREAVAGLHAMSR
jgi:mannose-6-phosphate isomerase